MDLDGRLSNVFLTLVVLKSRVAGFVFVRVCFPT